MRAPLALAPAVLVLALAACGGDTAPQQIAQASAVATAAQTASGAPTTAAPQGTASAAAAAPATATITPAETPTPGATEAAAAGTPTPVPAAAKSTPAPTATPLPKDAPTATPTPKPKAAKKNGPLICLSAASVKQSTRSGTGLWSGHLAGPQDLVAVDGPYKSPRDAQLSVESLAGVSDAEVGGNYVVSASLATKAKATIHEVADCLDARDR